MPTLKQRRSKQSFVCSAYIMWRRSAKYAKCQPTSVSQSPGQWKGRSSNAAACCGRSALAIKCSCMLNFLPVQKQHLLVCKLGIHVASHPARKLSPDRAKIRLQQAGPRKKKNKRVLGAQKWGQAFLPDFNCWANWWTQFWVQISTPKMGPQYVEKGTSLV